MHSPTPGLSIFITYLGKITLAIADEQARLAASAVANNDNLLGVSWRFRDMRPRRVAARRGAHGGADGAVT